MTADNELRAKIEALRVMDDGSDTANGWNCAIERALSLIPAEAPAPADRTQPEDVAAWQSMDTAPTDGTKFVASNGRLTFTTYSQGYYEKFPHEEGGPVIKACWTAEDASSVWTWNPKLWMPLPDTRAALAASRADNPISRQITSD